MKSIAQIKEELKTVTADTADAFIKEYSADERSGVQALVVKAEKMKDALAKELERLEKMRVYEHQYEENYTYHTFINIFNSELFCRRKNSCF